MGGVVARTDLYARLSTAAQVTVVSAPAGSGKTVLVESWVEATGIGDRVAWVSVGTDLRDPERFWPAVVDALGRTGPGQEMIRALRATPDLNGLVVADRLLRDLDGIAAPVWLVLDDVHAITSDPLLRQLGHLLERAPERLRLVLVTRHDPRLGLHRHRVAGRLTEIGVPDLRFTHEEAAELLAAAGVQLSGPGLALLLNRTEGWAAGLRLAALSLADHEQPERFLAEFSGTERTVAEYLLAEVLERLPGDVREMLLRTSVLHQVCGELADLLTGRSDGDRILQDLDARNAFVSRVDASGTWFRYHRLFADLLRGELRRTAPDQVDVLRRDAAGWLAEHGRHLDAIRLAQAAGDWAAAAAYLIDRWPTLQLDGRSTTVHELLTAFPAEAMRGELAALAVADELVTGTVDAAGRYLDQAEQTPGDTPPEHRGRAALLHALASMMLARRRGDLTAATEGAARVRDLTLATDGVPPGIGDELTALALVGLDSLEFWNGDFAEARRHLELSRTLARRTGRPYVEFRSLAYQTAIEFFLSFDQATEHAREALAIAEQHGWSDEPAAGAVYMTLGAVLTWQARLGEADHWVARAEQTIVGEAEPLAGIGICQVRALLEAARGRHDAALAAFTAAARLHERLTTPHRIGQAMHAFLIQVRVFAGELERATAMVEALPPDRVDGDLRRARATLALALDDPRRTVDELAPVLSAAEPALWNGALAEAYLLEAIARDALGERAAASAALERSLDLAEPDGLLVWFLIHPARDLVARHGAYDTRHAGFLGQIRAVLAGHAPAPRPERLIEPLSGSEIRVLRYLATNLSAPEIAGDLTVSPNTVKTHVRNIYRKLGVNRRSEAVVRARALGLLAPARAPGPP